MLDSIRNENNNYKKFEECITKIFKEAEYETVSNVALEQDKGDIDIVAKKDEKIIYITKNINKLLVPCIFIAHKIHVIVSNKNIV